MNTFPGSPPAPVSADLAAPPASLDISGVQPKTLDRNVVIAGWKFLGFGKVLEKWESPDSDISDHFPPSASSSAPPSRPP